MTDRSEPSSSWTARSLASAILAGLACLMAFVLLYGDRAAAAGASGIWLFVTEVLLGHAAGGALAGACLAGQFGRHGPSGWLRALLAGAAASLLAGLIGGALSALPDLLGGASFASWAVRAGAGALVTPLAIAGAPWLGAVWLGAIAALHLACRRLRRAA